MFKTIHDCRLDLVGHSVGHDPEDPNYPYSVDLMPCSAARVSFGKEDKTGKDLAADVKLMNYLAKHQHMTPFEHQSATFLVEVPLFIRSQIHRHRTFAYNEISRRYTDENLEFWIPDTFRGQAKSNRQASSDEIVTNIHRTVTHEISGKVEHFDIDPYTLYTNRSILAEKLYQDLVDNGVAREIARAVLPQSLLTKFYMTGNLRNWAHFLKLRLDEHSQYEVRVVAERIEKELRQLWPNAVAALLDA